MATLSEEMKSKRDVRRRVSLLIIDEDFGNFGLYKAILAAEYDLECIYDLQAGISMCESRPFDMVIADESVGVEKIGKLCGELIRVYGDNMPELLVIEEAEQYERRIQYLCMGAKGFIPKPFTKDGMINILRETMRRRRDDETKQRILIVDNDYDNLVRMKRCLGKKYNLNIVNDTNIAERYVSQKKVDLIICDMSALGFIENTYEMLQKQYDNNVRLLFMTDKPDEENIKRGVNYKPQGFIIKPVSDDELIQVIDRIFLVDSYIADMENK